VRSLRLAFYPFLGAVYPVLAMAAANGGQIVELRVLLGPLAISLLVSGGTWLLLRPVVRNSDRRAFLTLMVVILFASYGFFTAAIAGASWTAPYAHTVIPLLSAAVYVASVTYLVFRLASDLRGLTRFLNLFSIILVLWVTIDLMRQISGRSSFGSVLDAAPGTIAASWSAKPSPDIYLLVLDKYTGRRSLRDNFNFDNSAFEAFLRSRGFIVPGSPHANYLYTTLSLASLLNYRYLDDLPQRLGPESRDQAYVSSLIEDNAVWRFLRERSYRFIFFPTAFSFTGSNRFADLQLPDPREIPSEFEIVWRRTTLAEPILWWVCRRIYCSHVFPWFTNETPQLLEWKFERLKELPKLPRDGRPLFVFAHFTVPHEPYIFNADCSTRRLLWPSYFVVRDETLEKNAYVAQLTCVNQRLESIVDQILRDSRAPPVILLQSDHGHGRMMGGISDLRGVTADRLSERADIFAAYDLPGVDGAVIYDSITPVNVFRTVFRQYFKVELAHLPDETYWSPEAHPFKFTKVTSQVSHGSGH
jgi:hypothetical protein